MDESLRGKGCLYERDDYATKSFCGPEITITSLYLRGENKEYDNEVFFHDFDSVSKAKEICDFIVEGVNAINLKKEPKEEKVEGELIKIL